MLVLLFERIPVDDAQAEESRVPEDKPRDVWPTEDMLAETSTDEVELVGRL